MFGENEKNNGGEQDIPSLGLLLLLTNYIFFSKDIETKKKIGKNEFGIRAPL